ncbi:hypothetical protein PR003_g29966 [Phytophthora rubi]|uniref:Uncharacterized protein n=1 Tax=Phytophthora rubi TaxID=129364 RepID=A0A6A4BDR9_9STRA|nr:hypothetical protein PR003_g29966 [Phytophthora rubi]
MLNRSPLTRALTIGFFVFGTSQQHCTSRAERAIARSAHNGLHAQSMRIIIDEGSEYGGLELGQGRLDAEPQALGEPTKDGKYPEVETTATLLLLLISFVVAALVLPMFLLFDS